MKATIKKEKQDILLVLSQNKQFYLLAEVASIQSNASSASK